MAGHKVTVLGQIPSPCYLGDLGVYWMYCLDWAQVDPQLNAVAAAAVAAGLEAEIACGFAAGPGQEARGSSLKENIRHLRNFRAYRHHIFRHVHSHKQHLSALPYPSINLSTHQCSSQWKKFCEILHIILVHLYTGGWGGIAVKAPCY